MAVGTPAEGFRAAPSSRQTKEAWRRRREFEHGSLSSHNLQPRTGPTAGAKAKSTAITLMIRRASAPSNISRKIVRPIRMSAPEPILESAARNQPLDAVRQHAANGRRGEHGKHHQGNAGGWRHRRKRDQEAVKVCCTSSGAARNSTPTP